MKDRYFSVEVKPTLPASKQHAAAFTAGDVLFDYTEFEIPKGTSRLIGATMKQGLKVMQHQLVINLEHF